MPRCAIPDGSTPAIAFASAKGNAAAAGQRGENPGFRRPDGRGGTEKGISIAARPGSQITAPCDGWVVYAGTFRNYGQLLILNAGGGYHVLLAGMERISVDLGQFVVTGEPVAAMGGGAPSAACPAGAAANPCYMSNSERTGTPSIPAHGGPQLKARRFADDAQDIPHSPRRGGGRGRDADRDPAAICSTARRAQAAAADTYRQLSLFGDVFERVRADYVEKPDDGKLVEFAINGMLAGLDPHSSYMDAKSFRDMQVQTRGEFGGLGIEVTMEDGLIKVVAPIDETPAAKAGIMANDIITHLDDEPVQGLTLNQAVEKMRGPVNTKIKLKIMRKGQDKPVEVAITRDIIRVRSVRSRIEGDDVGYIRITQFNEQTTEGLKKAIADLSAQTGRQAQGLRHRSAQQSGRPARSGDLGVGRVPGEGRDRLDPRPQCGRDPALQCARRRPDQGQAADRTDQRRLGLGVGDRGRRAAGPPARDGDRHALLRQGLGADDHPAWLGERRAAADHCALLHALRPLDPGQGHLAGHRSAAGRAGRAQGAHRHQGEASLRGHLKAEGDEQTGSQSYIPPDPKDDKALHTALDLVRGIQKNSAYPPNPKTAVPN